ncbi:MAG: hypothetical protein GY866_04925 [Proteobacteria bacterium]|nr:hypothetical protein [Pseudomonadota bacterium]
MEKPGTSDYVHDDLNQEFTAIGGHYVVTDEVRLAFGGREVLYVKGYAAFDTTCCGSGGCGFALVHGFVDGWKGSVNEKGLFVTRVELVREASVQKELRTLIDARETVNQVNFM